MATDHSTIRACRDSFPSRQGRSVESHQNRTGSVHVEAYLSSLLTSDSASQRRSEVSSTDEVERSAMLFQLVERLPEAQFRVIHMRFVEQKSIREIAQELARSEGAVKQLQLRAIENLRAQMEGSDA